MLSYRFAWQSVQEDLAGVGGGNIFSSDSEDEEGDSKDLEAPTVSPHALGRPAGGAVAAPGSQEAFKLRSQLVHSMAETGVMQNPQGRWQQGVKLVKNHLFAKIKFVKWKERQYTDRKSTENGDVAGSMIIKTREYMQIADEREWTAMCPVIVQCLEKRRSAVNDAVRREIEGEAGWAVCGLVNTGV